MVGRRKDSKGRVLKEGETQRKNGTYCYRWRDRDGKRQSVYAKTLQELRVKEENLRKDRLDGIRTDAHTITLDDLYDVWCSIKRGLKDNTFSNYKYLYDQFVREAIGDKRIVEIRNSDIRRFYISLIEKDGLKVSTVDSIHTVVHQILDLAVSDDYVRKNPSDNAMRELKLVYNTGKRKTKALTVDEQRRFLEYVKHSKTYVHWYPLFIVMLGTGMRIGEVTGLRWEDVNMHENYIDVNHTLVFYSKGEFTDGSARKCRYMINTPKTKNSCRTIPMMNSVRNALMQERENQIQLGLQCRSIIDGYTDFIFLNRFGEVMNNSVINKAIRRIIRDCNEDAIENGIDVMLPRFSCHSLRHTFTTRLCEEGISIKVIQEILGHADFKITMDIYTEVSEHMKEKEICSLEDFIEIA